MGKELDPSHATLEKIAQEIPSSLLTIGMTDFLQGRDPSTLLPVLMAYIPIPQEKIDDFVELIGYFRGNLGKKSQVTVALEHMPPAPLQRTMEALIKSPQFIMHVQHVSEKPEVTLETTIINSMSSLQMITYQNQFPPLVYSDLQRALIPHLEHKQKSQQELSLRRRYKQAPNRYPSLTLRQQGAQYLSLTVGYELRK